MHSESRAGSHRLSDERDVFGPAADAAPVDELVAPAAAAVELAAAELQGVELHTCCDAPLQEAPPPDGAGFVQARA